MTNHIKHPPLQKPDMGRFGRNEWAFLGTRCEDIRSLVQDLALSMPDIQTAYVDASHHPDTEGAPESFQLVFTDKQEWVDLSKRTDMSNPFDTAHYFAEADMIFINGNHFAGRRQVLILDAEKERSLIKRLGRLTDLRLIIRKTAGYWPSFLEQHVSGLDRIPVIPYEARTKIKAFFKEAYAKSVSPVYGLVLAGGKSRRMGFDKGKIPIMGKEARLHLFEILSRKCNKTYLSIRKEQQSDLENYPVLVDRFLGLGPYGALLTAFLTEPDVAWLVVATDLMQFPPEAVAQLLSARDPSSTATAFLNPDTGFPDPLATIWEPKSYARLLEFLRMGYSCPRKVLINSNINLLTPKKSRWLMNVNTQEDLTQL